jgi:hypothetical protein
MIFLWGAGRAILPVQAQHDFNLRFLHVTQLAVKHMSAQKTSGSVVTITSVLARKPIRDISTSWEQSWQPQELQESNRST